MTAIFSKKDTVVQKNLFHAWMENIEARQGKLDQEREALVKTAIAAGLTQSEIASELGVSRGTVGRLGKNGTVEPAKPRKPAAFRARRFVPVQAGDLPVDFIAPQAPSESPVGAENNSEV